MKVKVNDLQGKALDYCVALCENRSEPGLLDRFSVNWYTWGNTRYSSNWSQGGPIIEREITKVFRNVGGTWSAMILRNDPVPYDERGTSLALTQKVQFNGAGKTPLIAAMRCYVASKLGDVVSIPEELL